MYSLKELFDSKVFVTLADSWCAGEDKNKHYEIKCKRGVIWPYSETSVGVETTVRTGQKILKVLKDKARIYRTTQEGLDIEVPLALTEVTFRYMKPKRRKQLSPERRAALAESISRVRLAGKSNLPSTNNG